jgi:hypothetical protein
MRHRKLKITHIPESQVSRSGLITLEGKQTGKPIAGNRHDGFDEAGAWKLTHGLATEALPEETGSNG